jgi:hypothetical protein
VACQTAIGPGGGLGLDEVDAALEKSQEKVQASLPSNANAPVIIRVTLSHVRVRVNVRVCGFLTCMSLLVIVAAGVLRFAGCASV